MLAASLLLFSREVAALQLKDATGFLKTTGTAAGFSETTDISTIIAAIISALLGLVGIVFFILIIYGGLRWMTASGNEENIKKARKLIINAVIGLAIVMAAYSITYFIARALETQP